MRATEPNAPASISYLTSEALHAKISALKTQTQHVQIYADKFFVGKEAQCLEHILTNNNDTNLPEFNMAIVKIKSIKSLKTLIKKYKIQATQEQITKLFTEIMMRSYFIKKISELDKVNYELDQLHTKKKISIRYFKKFVTRKTLLCDFINFLQENWDSILEEAAKKSKIHHHLEKLSNNFQSADKILRKPKPIADDHQIILMHIPTQSETTSTNMAPADILAISDASIDDAPVDDAPVNDAPVNDAPVDDTPNSITPISDNINIVENQPSIAPASPTASVEKIQHEMHQVTYASTNLYDILHTLNPDEWGSFLVYIKIDLETFTELVNKFIATDMDQLRMFINAIEYQNPWRLQGILAYTNNVNDLQRLFTILPTPIRSKFILKIGKTTVAKLSSSLNNIIEFIKFIYDLNLEYYLDTLIDTEWYNTVKYTNDLVSVLKSIPDNKRTEFLNKHFTNEQLELIVARSSTFSEVATLLQVMPFELRDKFIQVNSDEIARLITNKDELIVYLNLFSDDDKPFYLDLLKK